MKKINIIFLVLSLEIGGTEKHIYNLISNLNRDKYNPIICCLYGLGEIGDALIKDGVKVYHGLMRSRGDLSGVLRLIRIIKNEGICIMYIMNSPLTVCWGLFCAKLTGVGKVLTRITVTEPVSHAARRRLVNNVALSFFDIIIAQSNFHKKYLIKHYVLNAERIKVVYNGVAVESFRSLSGAPSLRQELDIPDGAPVVGIVARLSPEKNVSLFLNAAGRILLKFPDSHFVVAGDGPERRKLEKIACELSIQAKVHFLGMRQDIPRIISSFDVAVMSSNIENFSNAVLEYMAAAKPVIATDVGNTHEQVVEGETGFLISSGDAEALAASALKLLKDRGLSRKMGEAGKARVNDNFTLRRMMSTYESLFAELSGEN